MVRFDSDQVNWVLVVILVAMALLLALVSSSAYGDVPQPSAQASARANQATQFEHVAAQERKEVRTPSEAWYVARELYQAGRVEEARGMFEKVVAKYPSDPSARMWAGMAAFRTGDRASAIRHWNAVWCDEAPVMECGVWTAIALAAAELESGQPDRAARFIVPLERGDFGLEFADHPIVSFYAALVYEQLAIAAPKYREAVEESLGVGGKFSPALASSDGSQIVSPNSQSWLIFLTKRAMQRTIRGARSIDRAAPVVPESATVEPSFAPTVGELLEALGSADFASQARRKLRALQLYESSPKRTIELFDGPDLIKRGRFIA
jgi:tetratricopeptide (TPR) repeat protein